MRQKLQNSRGYAESPEFLPALGLFIFKKFANLQKKLYTYMYYTDTKLIMLPCSLARVGN